MGLDLLIMFFIIALAIIIYLYVVDELKLEFRHTLLHKQLRFELEHKHIASIVLHDITTNQKYLVDKTENIKAFLAMFDKLKIKKTLYKGCDDFEFSKMNFKFMVLSKTEDVFPIMYSNSNQILLIGEEAFILKHGFENIINEWITSMYSSWAVGGIG